MLAPWPPGGMRLRLANVRLDGMCGAVSEKAEAVTSRDGTGGLAPGPAVQPAARRRRPTGTPPPLPHPVSVSTMAWLVAVVVVLAGAILVSARAPSLRLDDQANTAVLRFFARARTPWLTGVANAIVAAGPAGARRWWGYRRSS